MSIDKDSNGLPGINVHKRTTRVNLGIVVAVVIFLVVMALVAVWIARYHNPRSTPPPTVVAVAETGRA